MTHAETLRALAAQARGNAKTYREPPVLPSEGRFAAECDDDAAALDAGARALEVVALAEGADVLPVAAGTYETARSADDVAWCGIAGPAAVDAATLTVARRALAARLIKTALALLGEKDGT